LTLFPRILASAALLALLHAASAQTPASTPAAGPAADPAVDPYTWLEDVQGERALNWVRERNAGTQQLLQSRPDYAGLHADLKTVLNAKDRIPGVVRQGDWFYNFWVDAEHKRGLWRRATLAEFRKPAPQWETVLDLDALGAQEKESWVWAGASCLAPAYRRCLVQMSRGGGDAQVAREFDTVDKRFVADGFSLPEAKLQVEWIDQDSLYVGTDFGAGSMTDSGYPRVVKRWQRGTPLASAVTVFEGIAKDVSAGVSVDHTPGFERTVFARGVDFYNNKQFLLVAENRGGKKSERLVELDVPSDARTTFLRDKLLIELRSDWKLPKQSHPSGALLMADAAAYLKGERKFQVLFTPTATRSLQGYTSTRTHLLLNVSEHVTSQIEEWSLGPKPLRRRVKAPSPGTLTVAALHDPQLAKDALAEDYLVKYADFLTPDTLFLAHAGSDAREVLKARTAQFDATGLRAEQLFATSKDGTQVPYFVVWPKGATADGNNPTLLYGYGGFQVSLQPWYSGGYGKAWYSRGGVLVVANLRGGGEYGPAWHQAALKANKQKSYDDYIAVAEDLIKRKITSPQHLGIMGGSNGGLLVGATFVQRPDLFNAVVCQVPLLDMRKFHTLLAGASWMAEYGNPDDPADWASLSKISPYHNVKKGVKYPKVLFTTSTRDDRVHPAHARKMAARMLEQGHELLYYENIEGGHGGAADNEQRATLQAMEFSYLWMQLGR
jgi:prolyl oligopeptidase